MGPHLKVWLEDCRSSFASLTRDKMSREAAEAKAQESKAASQVRLDGRGRQARRWRAWVHSVGLRKRDALGWFLGLGAEAP